MLLNAPQATYLGIDNTVKKLPAPKALKAWDEPTFVVKVRSLLLHDVCVKLTWRH